MIKNWTHEAEMKNDFGNKNVKRNLQDKNHLCDRLNNRRSIMGGAVVSRDASNLKFEVLHALKVRKELDLGRTGDPIALDSVIEEFEHLHHVITSIQHSYKTFAEEDGKLHYLSLVKAIQSIHVHASTDHIQAIFNMTDDSSTVTVDFKEYLTVLTIAVITNELPVESEETTESGRTNYKLLRDMLSLLTSVYLIFDPDCNGYITRKDVDSVLSTTVTSEAKHQNHSLHRRVFDQENWKDLVSFIS